MSIRDDKINDADNVYGCFGFIFTIVVLTGLTMLLLTFL